MVRQSSTSTWFHRLKSEPLALKCTTWWASGITASGTTWDARSTSMAPSMPTPTVDSGRSLTTMQMTSFTTRVFPRLDTILNRTGTIWVAARTSPRALPSQSASSNVLPAGNTIRMMAKITDSLTEALQSTSTMVSTTEVMSSLRVAKHMKTSTCLWLEERLHFLLLLYPWLPFSSLSENVCLYLSDYS